jgi:predicted nucleic acid-binding protein
VRPAVFDASVLVKSVLGEPGREQATAAYVSADRVHAPDLLQVECANAFWKRHVRGDITLAEALTRLETSRRFDIEYHDSVDLLPVALRIAADLRHPVYDCLYIALAIAEDADLVTADARMRETAEAAGLGERVVWVESA